MALWKGYTEYVDKGKQQRTGLGKADSLRTLLSEADATQGHWAIPFRDGVWAQRTYTSGTLINGEWARESRSKLDVCTWVGKVQERLELQGRRNHLKSGGAGLRKQARRPKIKYQF